MIQNKLESVNNKTEDPSVQYAGKGYVQRNPEDPKEP